MVVPHLVKNLPGWEKGKYHVIVDNLGSGQEQLTLSNEEAF